MGRTTLSRGWTLWTDPVTTFRGYFDVNTFHYVEFHSSFLKNMGKGRSCMLLSWLDPMRPIRLLPSMIIMISIVNAVLFLSVFKTVHSNASIIQTISKTLITKWKLEANISFRTLQQLIAVIVVGNVIARKPCFYLRANLAASYLVSWRSFLSLHLSYMCSWGKLEHFQIFFPCLCNEKSNNLAFWEWCITQKKIEFIIFPHSIEQVDNLLPAGEQVNSEIQPYQLFSIQEYEILEFKW